MGKKKKAGGPKKKQKKAAKPKAAKAPRAKKKAKKEARKGEPKAAKAPGPVVPQETAPPAAAEPPAIVEPVGAPGPSAPPAPPPAESEAAPADAIVSAICQSCGVPMGVPDMRGFNTDGSRSMDYCAFCYENGEFRRPDMTLEEMVDFVAGMMHERMGLTLDDAKASIGESLPKLKRWQR